MNLLCICASQYNVAARITFAIQVPCRHGRGAMLLWVVHFGSYMSTSEASQQYLRHWLSIGSAVGPMHWCRFSCWRSSCCRSSCCRFNCCRSSCSRSSCCRTQHVHMMHLQLIHVALRKYHCLTTMSTHSDTKSLSSLCAKQPLCLQALCCHGRAWCLGRRHAEVLHCVSLTA